MFQVLILRDGKQLNTMALLILLYFRKGSASDAVCSISSPDTAEVDIPDELPQEMLKASNWPGESSVATLPYPTHMN